MAVQGGKAGLGSLQHQHQKLAPEDGQHKPQHQGFAPAAGHSVGSTHASTRDGYQGWTPPTPALEMGTGSGTSRGTIDGQQNGTQVLICRRQGHSPARSGSNVCGLPHSERLLRCQPPTNLYLPTCTCLIMRACPICACTSTGHKELAQLLLKKRVSSGCICCGNGIFEGSKMIPGRGVVMSKHAPFDTCSQTVVGQAATGSVAPVK